MITACEFKENIPKKEEMNKQRYYLDISTPQSKILSFVAKYNIAIKENCAEDSTIRMIDEISFQYITFKMFKEQLEVFSGHNIDASDYLDYIKEVE